MVDNQHRQIKGYRDLSESEINTINMIKAHGPELLDLIEDVMALPDSDKRWVDIARTHLQEGMMALTRAVAKPEGF